MKKRRFLFLALSAAAFVLLNLNITVQADEVVYEGFDYTDGAPVDTQNGGVGWDTAWATTGPGATFHTVGAGLAFGALDVSGGSAVRATRNGTSNIDRTITAASTTALTADDSTSWFSVLMSPLGNPGNGFELNMWGTLIFGDTALTTAGQSTAPGIGAGGNAVGVGFSGRNGSPDVDNTTYAGMTIQGVTYSAGDFTQDDANRILVGGTTSLIVGQVDWAANGADDTLSLYNVLDPTAALPAAFSTMLVDLDQSNFNVISISAGQTSIFDEIRFGTSQADVLPASAVPEPSSLAILGFGSLALLRRRRA